MRERKEEEDRKGWIERDAECYGLFSMVMLS